MALKQKITDLVEDTIIKLNELYFLNAFKEKEWTDIPHNLPDTFINVVLRYKITKDRFTLDFRWEHNYLDIEILPDFFDFTIAEIPDVDSSLLKTMYLKKHSLKQLGKSLNKLRLVSSGEEGEPVYLKAEVFRRTGIEIGETRITAPITNLIHPDDEIWDDSKTWIDTKNWVD